MATLDFPSRLRVTDMHTAGEPVRIVEAGYPDLRGTTILEKRRDARKNHDHLRCAIMLEPRGHAGMYGVIPTTASHPEADLAVLFTHQEGYSTMCGHATIAIGRWAVDSGRVALVGDRASFKLEVPCGIVDVNVRRSADGWSVAFKSVASFVSHFDHRLDVPGFGRVRIDIAYGGAFYGILPASRLGLSLMETPLEGLVAAGVAITRTVRSCVPIDHPDERDLGFLYGTILTDDVELGAPDGHPSYNLCIFAEGQIDRSPTGSGVTARLALAAGRGLVDIGRPCEIRGVSGQGFVGRLVQMEDVAGRVVSRVEIEGTAYYCGRSELLFEEKDPFASGFQIPARIADVIGR